MYTAAAAHFVGMNDNEKNEVHDSKNVGTWTIRHRFDVLIREVCSTYIVYSPLLLKLLKCSY